MNSDGGSKLVTRTSKSLKRKNNLDVFSDGSHNGFRRIMSMFLHQPNFLKLTHVDIYTSVFSQISLICDKVCGDFWI